MAHAAEGEWEGASGSAGPGPHATPDALGTPSSRLSFLHPPAAPAITPGSKIDPALGFMAETRPEATAPGTSRIPPGGVSP